MQTGDNDQSDESETELEDGQIPNAPVQLESPESELYRDLNDLYDKRGSDQRWLHQDDA